MTDYILTNDASIIGGTQSTEAGKFDPNYADRCVQLDYNAMHGVALPENENSVWVQFQYYYEYGNTGTAEDGYMWAWPHSSGYMWAGIGLSNGIAKQWGMGNANTLFSYGDSMSFPFNQLVTVDINLVFTVNGAATSSAFAYYVNGTPIIQYSGPRYINSNSGSMKNVFYLGGYDYMGTSARVFVSNLRVSNESTLGTRFRLAPLSTVGTYNEFPGGFAALTNATPTNATFSDVAGQRVSGTISTTGFSSDQITNVKLVSQVRNGSPTADPNTLGHFTRIGGTNYDGAITTPMGMWSSLVTDLPVNPATGAAWSLAELGTTEFGLISSKI